MLKDVIKKCRSYRRFYEEVTISREDLMDMVDNARLSASARNAQSLKYYLSNNRETNELIFPSLSWAGYLKEWLGPAEGERPSAYIIMVNDTEISTNYFCDHGIAVQSILLTATEKGFGGCIIASANKEDLRSELGIPKQYEILLVVALGKPKEIVVIDPMNNAGDYKYWRDKDQVHHVPKRDINELIISR
jgi:nitroreductase